LKLLVLALTVLTLLAACGGGGESGSQSASSSASASQVSLVDVPVQKTGDVLISGKVTYDRIMLSPDAVLNFNQPQIKAARGITVELWDIDNTVIRRTRTNALGEYAFGAPPQTAVRVVALAQMQKPGVPGWNFDVLDNTQNSAMYSLADESRMTSGLNEQRDLHAASGWDATIGRFTDETLRPAAPFAILDTAYEVVELLTDTDPSVLLPACHFNWSHQNIAVPNNSPQTGEIGITHYEPGDAHNIYVLGSVYDDSDEYDSSVLIHEMAHYLEDTLSRSDSIGGDHALEDRLDMRVAFSEGYANAFAGIVNGDSLYKDSFGVLGDEGLVFDLEEHSAFYKGWFNENSIGKVIFDLVDTTNEPGDDLSLSFDAIYNVLTDAAFVQSDVFSSIFLFRDVFDSQQSASNQQAFARLLAEEQIFGEDRYGSKETNNGRLSATLPVYRLLSMGGSVESCSTRSTVEYNGLGVSGYVYFSLSRTQEITLTIERSSRSMMRTTDPDAILYRNGEIVSEGVMTSIKDNRESRSLVLTRGEYVLEVYEATNVDKDNSTGGLACFLVSLN